ncbi:tyrosine-type recombinase/integrase [Lyngbya sp. CCY1209]|uniref:tyrosine-type recombinase/integrase n=1 Tax=Lyngbya sp. CCY1209 TaxID=2886103 RepID=UPI002D1FE041|nr:tyrosine-type recombinase/integrase [Lyngbya sp. CCY1209]MEB3886160.1 site-specific integrase [Lyngbya sp. CCY1209]
MKKASTPRYKGKVGVSCVRGRFRLTLPRELFGNEQVHLYLGLQETPENRKIAEARAKTIEADIAFGNFDPTLERYKSTTATPQKRLKPQTLVKVFDDYIQTRKSRVRPGTWNNGYLVTLRRIERSPFCHADISTIVGQDIFDWAIQHFTPDTTARFMTQLNAAFKWAIAKKLANGPSPFDGMSTKAKKLKKSDDDDDINPFGKDERDRIIQSFGTDPRHSHNLLYVLFCFFTGCRPSEAIALQWSDVAPDYSKVTFTTAIVSGKGGRKRCKGLKTQKRREFPCNEQVQDILKEARSRSNSEIVFPSKTGKPIQIGDFRARHWKPVLLELGIEYRKPYQMRHTFITQCLEAGVDVKDVARLVGNSPGTIYKNYAGKKKGLSVPEL